MANNFITNIFRTQENVNKDNMNYTVADKDQKLSAFFPMPPQNLPSGIFPGVICNGIGTIDNQFGFNSTSNTFSLTAGILRFPDAISNNTPYSITNQTASISQFLALDAPNPQPPLTIASGTFYLIATLQVNGIGGAYQYTNTSPNSLIPYTIILTSAFTGINQIALCLITINGTNVTISTDINCAVNYGQKVVQLLQQGRLSGISGNPYSDTPSDNSGSPNLYFTPTELGNLISLYNTTTNSWVTQNFTELSLPVSSLFDLPNAVDGSLSTLSTPSISTDKRPSGIVISPDGNNVYCVNYDPTSNSISQYTRIKTGNNKGQLSGSGFVLTQTGVNPFRIIVSPDGRHVYVTDNGAVSISQYSRASSGQLTAILPSIGVGNQPYGIAISPNISEQNSHVYVVNNADNNISQFNRNTSSGVLSFNSNSGAGASPVEIIVSPDGLHVYCTNNFNGNQGNTVSQYSRNTSSGVLTPILPSIDTGTSPRGIAISPDGNFVYVVNNAVQSVSQYRRNSSSGILTPFTTRDVSAGYWSNQITISPDGLNVYVTNSTFNQQGDSTISEYSRDTTSGQLSALPSPNTTIGTGTNPQVITISPDGLNVYCTNDDDNSLSQYRRQLPTAPTVSLSSPSPTTNVVLTTPITLTFSEAVAGVDTTTIQFQVQGGQPQTISINQSGNSYTLVTSALTLATQYIVKVLTGITSVRTGLAVASTQFNFTTIPAGPTVQLISPTSITNVSLTPTVQLEFSVPVTGVNTTTINFKPTGGSIIPITITPNGNIYTINLSQSLSLATKYSVVVNSGISSSSSTAPVAPITFYFTTTAPQLLNYDIYVGNTTSNILTLAKDVFSNGTTTNRLQLANGKWVNAHSISTPNGNIQPQQGLLVGSISIYNGLVQSWTGNRSIWNLYNQVSKALVANAGSIDPTSASNPTYLWTDATPNFRNQFLNNSNGIGRLSFILDLLYNKGLVLLYNGSGVSGLATDTGITGIIANVDAGDGTTPPIADYIPLAFAIYGNDPARVTTTPNNWHTLTYLYNYNSSILQSVSNIAVGFNFIQKIEKTFTTGYFSDTGGGLSTEFWG